MFAAVVIMVVAMIIMPMPVVITPVFLTPVIFMAFFSPVFFHALVPVACRGALALAALEHFVAFCGPHNNGGASNRIGMDVFAAVHPGSPPWSIVDDDDAAVPGNAVITPAPGPESDSQSDAKAKPDSCADKEAWTRPHIDDCWIVIGNYNVIRTRRQDRNIWPAAHDILGAAAQIPEVARSLAHSLYGIHYVLLLGQKRVTQISGPVHVRGHHLQNRGERQQGLHGGVPGQLVSFNCSGQLIAVEIVVLVSPAGGFRNLVRKSCRRQCLREQGIRVQRYPGNQPVKLSWWVKLRSLRRSGRGQRAAH